MQPHFKSRPLLCGILATLLASGCQVNVLSPAIKGSGKLTTLTPEVGAFDQIQVAIAADVTVRRAAESAVTITIDDNLASHLRTTVAKNELHIESDATLDPSTAIKVEIATPSLSQFVLAGAGTTQIDELSGPHALLTIAGAGDVTANVSNAETLKLSIAGAGTMTLTGAASTVDISMAGAGDVHAGGLQAQSVDVSIAGSGTVDVHADSKLNVSVTGSGDVRYSGAGKVEQSILGAGSVSKTSRAAVEPPATSAGDSRSDAPSPPAN
jgi:hypothetical protein